MKKNSENSGQVFKFKIYSNEDEEFLREIEIKPNHTFFDFHKAIQSSVGYEQGQMASFFLSDENWEKGREITLFEMSDDEDSDILVMDVAMLSEFITPKNSRLVYVFDFFSERAFFIELLEVKNENNRNKYPLCTRSLGIPPAQIVYGEKESEELDNIFEEDLEDDEFYDNDSFPSYDDFDQLR
jgi:hypothetical protein